MLKVLNNLERIIFYCTFVVVKVVLSENHLYTKEKTATLIEAVYFRFK